LSDKRVAVERRLGLAEHLRNDWVFDAEEGTTVEQIQTKEFWSLVAYKFNHFDRIEVRLETGEWIAELVVRDKGLNWALIALLKLHEFEKTTAPQQPSDSFEVMWRGNHHKFAVRRKMDGEVVQNGFPDRNAAFAWITNHERMTALERA